MTRTLARAAATAALMIPPLVLSHSEGEVQSSVVWTDCHDLPTDAATVLPAPVSEWTRLDCRPYGQILAQKTGWTWRYTGSFTTEVVVAAMMGDGAQREGGARHFTAVEVSQAQDDVAQKAHERFAREVSSYGYFAAETRPQAVYTLQATNDVGDKIWLHFLEHAEGRLWGIACTPDCKPENVFQVQKVGG